MSMREVIETLKFPLGKKIRSDNEDEKSFDGNFYCKFLILSLQLPYETQTARDEVGSDEDSENLYLQLPSEDIVDSFADPAKVLTVSKRCCPACHALIKYVDENADEKILYPGHHENWVTAALPPWLPRKAGMAVIKAAEAKLVERVQEYLKSGTPLSDPGIGTSPITSNCVDDLEDIDPDGIHTPAEWSNDQGEKGKRRKSEEEADTDRSLSPTKRR